MDETPEELEQIKREAEQIDVYRYRKRFRALGAIALGAAMAGLVWLVMAMLDGRRNPCERVMNHFCAKDPTGVECKTRRGILDESLHDESASMRAHIKADCQSKIDRLKEEDGVDVK
jgi:hypothetical protein